MKEFDPEDQNYDFSQLDLDNDSKLSILEKFIGVIIAPKETLSLLVEISTWKFPAILIVITSFLYNLITMSNLQSVVAQAIKNNRSAFTIDQANAIADSWSVTNVFLLPAMNILSWVLGALLFLFVIRLFGEMIEFKKVLLIVGNSYVIFVIFSFISLMIALISGTYFLNTSLAAIAGLVLPSLKGTIIYGFLRGIDLFNAWQFWVIANGIEGVTEMSSKKALMISACVMGISNLLSASTAVYLN